MKFLLFLRKIPHWLSQRIAWYYANKFFTETANDLSLSNEKCDNQVKSKHLKSKLYNLKWFNFIGVMFFEAFSREKLVIYLRKGISKVIKEWLNEKSRLINQNITSLVFSFSRTNSEFIKPVVYFDYGLKNKRRIMEDKTACYDNIDILNTRRLYDLKRTDATDDDSEEDDDAADVIIHRRRRRPAALFAVFDGHCGADCAQYASTHLPMAIIDRLPDEPAPEQVADTFRQAFRNVNDKFTEKARDEVLFLHIIP